MDTRKKLASLLRDARKQKGWTQDQLAKKMQVTRQYISKLERGSNFTIEKYDIVMEFLGFGTDICLSSKEG